MLYTKSILKPKSLEDGLRISIMSRHTLNDGITPDERINSGSYDIWLKELAPPEKLVGDFYKRNLPREEYNKKYLNYLRENDVAEKVKNLAEISLDENITLLCIEDDASECHRKIFSEECQRYFPELKVEHR